MGSSQEIERVEGLTKGEERDFGKGGEKLTLFFSLLLNIS
jgi:hypothetical protein